MNSKDGIHGQRQDMFRRDWELKGYRTPDKNRGTGSGRELLHLVGHVCTVQVPLGFDHKLVWTSQAELLIYGKRDSKAAFPPSLWQGQSCPQNQGHFRPLAKDKS